MKNAILVVGAVLFLALMWEPSFAMPGATEEAEVQSDDQEDWPIPESKMVGIFSIYYLMNSKNILGRIIKENCIMLIAFTLNKFTSLSQFFLNLLSNQVLATELAGTAWVGRRFKNQ